MITSNFIDNGVNLTRILLVYQLIIPLILSLSRIPEQTQKQPLTLDPLKLLLHHLKVLNEASPVPHIPAKKPIETRHYL
jgi:hypothetical protein